VKAGLLKPDGWVALAEEATWAKVGKWFDDRRSVDPYSRAFRIYGRGHVATSSRLDVATAWPDVKEVAMLQGKTRIPPVDVETLPDDLRKTLEEQRRLYGAPLYPYLFYARNAAFFRAAQGMWTALQRETKRVPGALRGLLNRRVAWWNGCEF